MSEHGKNSADIGHRKGTKKARDARPRIPIGGDQVQQLRPDLRIPSPLTGEALERRLEEIYDLILGLCYEINPKLRPPREAGKTGQKGAGS